MFFSSFLLQAGEPLVSALSGGIKKRKETGNPLAAVIAKSRGSSGFFKPCRQLRAANERAQSWWEQTFSCCLPSPRLDPGRTQSPSATPAWEPHPSHQPRLRRPLPLIFHARSSRTETLVENLTEAARDMYFLFHVCRGGQRSDVEGGKCLWSWVLFFFILFFCSFCNTHCSGECLALLMLSGSGSCCGLRSLVIRLLPWETREHWARAVRATLSVLPGQQVGKSRKWGAGGIGGCREWPRATGTSPQPGHHRVPTCGTRRAAVGGCTATPNGLRGAEGGAKGSGQKRTCGARVRGPPCTPSVGRRVSPPGKRSLRYI